MQDLTPEIMALSLFLDVVVTLISKIREKQCYS